MRYLARVDRKRLRTLLAEVAAGDIELDHALEQLSLWPFQDVGGEARIDNHRELRSGVPEVVLGEWKSAAQIARILLAMTERGQGALATRVSPDKAEAVVAAVPGATYHESARLIAVSPGDGDESRPDPATEPTAVAVVAAGTSDIGVAEEAALTLEFLGARPERVYDVGVAGVHRLLAETAKLRKAAVAIVVAGMEGALPSVVAGLVPCPVIAVPTSVGYGASIGGFAALFGMLSSCSPGVTVVNIDNGFGAAVAAYRMSRIRSTAATSTDHA